MKKNIVRLTESQLHGIIKESVKLVLREMNGENALVLIPNFAYKQSQLVEQWRNNNWYYTYPSVRDYVESLAEGDDVQNFFGWLFDDDRFNYTTVWTLPGNYEDAYQQFLNLFPSI